MGTWDQFIAVGAGRRLEGVAELEPLSRHGDWEFARLPDDFSVSPSAAVEDLARELRAPSIGAYVADSDAAAVYFASPGRGVQWLAINASYDDSDDAHTEQWLNPEAHRAAAAALSQWAAEHAPRKPSGTEIASALAELEDEELSTEIGQRALVFAEDGLRVIFDDLLGIASIDEAVFAVGRP